MQPWARIISVVAIFAYLGAAFLPCEPPAWLVSTGRAVHAATTSTPEPPHHAHHRSDEPRESSGAPHDHHSRGGAAADEPSNASRRSATRLATVEIKPKCPCGCSETQSALSGDVGRLGSIVPGVFVPRLSVSQATRAPESSMPLLVEFHRDLDRIPI